MIATITNSTVESFVICKQKAYLELVDRIAAPTQFELQLKTIATHMLEEFRQSVKNQTISSYDISRIEVKDFLELSEPVFLVCPSFSSQDGFDLTIDAVAIDPPFNNTRQLTCTPIAISPNQRISKNDRISLCIKTLLLLERNPGIQASHGKIIYGLNGTISKFSLQPYMRVSREALRQIKQLAENAQEPRHYKNKHCKVCKFESRCHAKFVEKDDLSLLGSIPPKQVARLNNHGIFTITQLSYTFRPKKMRKNLKPDTRPQYPLKALALREQKTHVIDAPSFPTTPISVFVDFEGLPDERFVYLVGMIVLQDGSERRESLWADSPGDDADRLMQDFLAILAGLGNFTMYHYGSFETRALQAFDKRTSQVFSQEVTTVINKSFNILPLLSMNVYPPIYTNELKDIASFLSFHWSDEGMNGAKSIVLRQNWELSRDPGHKSVLMRYNIDDCAALRVTKEWLAQVGTNLSLATESSSEVRMVANVQTTSYHKWGKPQFLFDELDIINKCAYFDYQRSKVYLRTSKVVRRALVRERGARSEVNKTDKRIVVPEKCPKCGDDRVITASKVLRRRRILDLKFMRNGVKKWVVEVDGKDFKCLNCNAIFECSMYGRNLLVWSMNQHVTYRVGLERVGQMLQENFNIEVPRYKLFYLKADLVQYYRETAKSVLARALRGELIQIDETSCSVRDASSSHVWVIATMDSVYYFWRPNREAGFLLDMLKGFHGVLVSDFYAGYDSLPCKQQRCLIHLIRDLNGDFRKNQLNLELRTIVTLFGNLLRTIVATIDQYGLRKQHLDKHHRDVDKFFMALTACQSDTEIAEHYQKRLMRNRDRLFEFLNHDGVPWNNNNAENAIKPFAKYRAMAGDLGTRKGLEDYLVLLSIQQTCKYRGISFLEFLRSGKSTLEL
jgi:predicted RecB family nuclease